MHALQTHIDKHRRHVKTCTCASPAAACCRWGLGPGCWKGLSKHLLKVNFSEAGESCQSGLRFLQPAQSSLSSACHTLLSLSKPDQNAVCSGLYLQPRGGLKKVRLYSTVYILLPGKHCLVFFYCVCQLRFELWVPIKTKHYIRGILPPPGSFKLHVEPAEYVSSLVVGELLSLSAPLMFLFTLSSYLFTPPCRPLISLYTLIISCTRVHILNRSQ